jgi:putative ubiquitin-RnfH superfamily antitoxin RatB of RatAB toxin-antitoxin module
MNDTKKIQIEIVEAYDTHVSRETLSISDGSCVRDALSVCTLPNAAQALINMAPVNHIADSVVGVWGRRVLLDSALTSGDRIELYRAVTADAKSARLARAREQGYRWQGRTRRAAKP